MAEKIKPMRYYGQTNAEFNDIKTFGIYKISGYENKPNKPTKFSGFGTLVVFSFSADYCTQFLLDANLGNGYVYKRKLINKDWQGWTTF